MDKETYTLLEKYMLECIGDSAHDKDHIYRVLYNAMDIAEAEQIVDYDVLICACFTILAGKNNLKIQSCATLWSAARKHIVF